MKRWMIMLLFLTLPAGYAFAGHGGSGREWKGARTERAREHRIAEHRAERRAEHRAERREMRRERWERQHRADRRPPGWDHGKKTGWHGAGVPPGQAKRDAYHHGRYAHHRGTRPVHAVAPPPRPAPPASVQQRIEEHRAAERAHIQPVAH